MLHKLEKKRDKTRKIDGNQLEQYQVNEFNEVKLHN